MFKLPKHENGKKKSVNATTFVAQSDQNSNLLLPSFIINANLEHQSMVSLGFSGSDLDHSLPEVEIIPPLNDQPLKDIGIQYMPFDCFVNYSNTNIKLMNFPLTNKSRFLFHFL